MTTRKKTKSPMIKFTLKDFQNTFASDDICLEYIRSMRYPERIDCPKCEKNSLFHRDKGKKSYSCDHCGYGISPTANTIFHKSKTPLTIWFYVIYQMAQTRGGISAKQIERETGVTYKTAWRIMHKIKPIVKKSSVQDSSSKNFLNLLQYICKPH